MLWSIFDVFFIPGKGIAATSIVFETLLLPPLIVYTYYFSTGSGTVTITGVPENISGFVDTSIERVYRNSYYRAYNPFPKFVFDRNAHGSIVLVRVPLGLAWTTWALTLAFIVTCWMEEKEVERKARSSATHPPAMRQAERFSTPPTAFAEP